MTSREQAAVAAKQFPQRLRAARKRAALTQDELAAIAEIASVTLSKLETGTNSPTFDILARLAHALNVSSDYLVGTDGNDDEQSVERLLLNQLLLVAGKLPTTWVSELLAVANLANAAGEV